MRRGTSLPSQRVLLQKALLSRLRSTHLTTSRRDAKHQVVKKCRACADARIYQNATTTGKATPAPRRRRRVLWARRRPKRTCPRSSGRESPRDDEPGRRVGQPCAPAPAPRAPGLPRSTSCATGRRRRRLRLHDGPRYSPPGVVDVFRAAACRSCTACYVTARARPSSTRRVARRDGVMGAPTPPARAAARGPRAGSRRRAARRGS